MWWWLVAALAADLGTVVGRSSLQHDKAAASLPGLLMGTMIGGAVVVVVGGAGGGGGGYGGYQ